jgi:hypothetical protein
MRLAVLDFHRALSGACQQSDKVDSIRTAENNLRVAETTAQK